MMSRALVALLVASVSAAPLALAHPGAGRQVQANQPPRVGPARQPATPARRAGSSSRGSLSAFNADLAQLYASYRPKGEALLRQELQKQLGGFRHDEKKLQVRVTRVTRIELDLDAAPGFTEISGRRVGLRVPRQGHWDLEVGAEFEVKFRLLWRWRTLRIPVRVIVEDLSVGTALQIDAADPRRPIVSRIERPDVRFKVKLRSKRLLTGLLARIASPFVRAAARQAASAAADDFVRDVTGLLQELAAPSSSAAGIPDVQLQPQSNAGVGPSAGPAIDGPALARAMEARRQAYLQRAAQSGGFYAELSRLELGMPLRSRAPLDQLLDELDTRPRQDKQDFKATRLLRLLSLHGNNPTLPQDLLDRAKRSLLDFRYWIDEPNPDDMVFSSENHQIMFASCELLAGQRWPNEVFTNDGRTGAAHAADARRRVLRWLDHRLRFGFSEWYSPVYYPHDVAPLLNLIDFSNDPEIETRASMVLDLLLFDLARLTQEGSFGLSAGRVYEEHKVSGRGQSIGDLIEILFGTRGGFDSTWGSTAGTSFATSRRYRVPHVLLGVGVDRGERFVDRTRMGIDFADGPAEGIGFDSLEDGMFWWGMSAFFAPETLGLTRRMADAWDLWNSDPYEHLQPLRNAPEVLLPFLSNQLGPASRGAVLSRANLYTFRNAAAQLSSVQAYRPGLIGFQQHAWQATLDLDASVWTTAPGFDGRDGPGTWTGSASLPLVVQHEDVAVILYNPRTLARLPFPNGRTHAFFPKAAFDEVRQARGWTFGRKGDGYVALYSAQPTRWTTTGPWADVELVADGERNVWICQVGCKAEDGDFDRFVQEISAAPIHTAGAGDLPHADPLTVSYAAPGLGRVEASWDRPATLAGRPILEGSYPRFDNPYARQPWGDPRLEVRHGGAALHHDRVAGTRTGDGL